MLRKKALKAAREILRCISGPGPSHDYSALNSAILNALEDAYLQGREDQALNRSVDTDTQGHLIATFDDTP